MEEVEDVWVRMELSPRGDEQEEEEGEGETTPLRKKKRKGSRGGALYIDLFSNLLIQLAL